MAPDEPPPQSVLSYRSPGATSHLNSSRVIMLVVVGATAIIVFNATFAVKAWHDWHAAERIVHARDPARRIVKVFQRGRPSVFPSKTAHALFMCECAWSTAWAAYLLGVALRRWHSDDSADAMSWKKHVGRFVRWKLWTSWIGVVLALYLGTNLRAVHDEFEVLGDWPHFSYATYSFLAIAGIITSTAFVHFLLLPSIRSADQPGENRS